MAEDNVGPDKMVVFQGVRYQPADLEALKKKLAVEAKEAAPPANKARTVTTKTSAKRLGQDETEN